jgi:hypothetical protein
MPRDSGSVYCRHQDVSGTTRHILDSQNGQSKNRFVLSAITSMCTYNRDIHKVRKTQHQSHLFGDKVPEILKNSYKIVHLALKGD